MSKPKSLFKTTIVIWSEFDASAVEIDDLAREAIQGEAYCSRQNTRIVEKYEDDPDWDSTEFFDCPNDDIEIDEGGNCIYCGQKCYEGQLCDEQQAGGFENK